MIISAVVWILITFTVPETYAPKLLARRAKKMRAEFNDDKFVSEQDLDMRPLAERLRIFLIRPFQLLFLEPIVFFLSVYMSVLYGLLYMFFVAFPIIYEEGKGYSAGITGLMFIPVAVGVLLSAACAPMVNKHYMTQVRKHNGKPPAEARLIPMMLSCWFIPVSKTICRYSVSRLTPRPDRPLHLRLDIVPSALVGWSCFGRLPSRLRFHLLVQQRKQLHW